MDNIEIDDCPLVKVTWQDAYDMPDGWAEPDRDT
jgi:hypothetical protein